MTPEASLRKRAVDALTMLLVSGLSLILLMYVGFGEAQRTYQQFYLDKLVAQARVVQTTMEAYLRPGLPLKQFVGFATLTEPILESDPAVAAMTTFDFNGAPVFSSGEATAELLDKPPMMTPGDPGYELRESAAEFQIVLPLRNKFETVGRLAITMPRAVVEKRVVEGFRPLLVVALGLALLFALFVFFGVPKARSLRVPWLQMAYAMTFLTMAAAVIWTLVSLYSEGAQVKAQALADSLGQRLAGLVAFNIDIEEIGGLDRTFGDYIRLNPDISAAGLTVDGQVAIHTDPAQVGRPWQSSRSTYEYVVDLTPVGSPREIRVAVALPTALIYRQIARSVKNFAALFVASALFAGLFLQLAGSVKRGAQAPETSPGPEERRRNQALALNLLKPVFFAAVFLEHLNYAFLPQFVYQVVEAAGLSAGFASAPFIAFYLCFALALVPAGHFAQHHSPRPLMYFGLLLAGVGLLLLASGGGFALVLAARALSGIGQGMLFIGVQSYILAMAPPDRRTQGAAIIVFGFQGGMIAGMAIGSLLVTYMGPDGVFLLSGVIAFSLAVYTLTLVPSVPREEVMDAPLGFSPGQVLANIGKVLRSLDFLKTMLLIGIPAKAVLTGVIIFALPLLLSQYRYAQEDIGQIIMIYAAGVVIASIFAARVVDRTGRTQGVLVFGAVVSGAGLFLIGLIGWLPSGAAGAESALVTPILVAGVATVGVAHGLINAPVVTHVADSQLAARVGASSLTATYRFLERLGHIAGPMIVAQLFLIGGQGAQVLLWMGSAVLAFGILFALPSSPGQAGTATREIAR